MSFQDGNCLELPSSLGEHRFLEQIFVPPGRDPWSPDGSSCALGALERESLAVEEGAVAWSFQEVDLEKDQFCCGNKGICCGLIDGPM